ncbi:MAG TPA: deoxyguanosinetriphosphate triphosphohydrolase, partial [Albitalea sp.]|nr:deoxyguanosinetriphosphate triphosphohydrolase [Albitalea sp.]
TQHPQLAGRRLLFESVRRMLSAQVYDVIDATRETLLERHPVSADEARAMSPIVRFTDTMRTHGEGLKRFLRDNLYRHPQVVDTTERAKQVIRELFSAYLDKPAEMPGGFSQRADRVCAVTDYIAGMTDRFALKEHQRLTGRSLF